MGRFRSIFSRKSKVDESDGLDVTPDPFQTETGGRSWNEGKSILPKQWHRVYGEHTAPELRFFSYKCPTLYKAIKKKRDAKNKRGYEWFASYAGVCTKCGKEFKVLPKNPIPSEEEPIPDPSTPTIQEGTAQDKNHTCDKCGGTIEEPDPDEYKEADDLLKHPVKNKRINWNHLQNVHDRDVYVLGNGYFLIKYKYFLNGNGQIVNSDYEMSDGTKIKRTPIGITVAREETVIKVEDDYGNPGGLLWACIHCRKEFQDKGLVYLPNKKPGKCIHCKTRETYDIHLIVSKDGNRTEGEGVTYYIEDEYFWTPFDADSFRFSFAPCEVISDQAFTLIIQYRHFRRMLEGQQSHSIIKWVRTKSLNGFWKFLNKIKMHFKNRDEFWMAADSDKAGDPAGVLKMEYTPQELDALSYHEELVNLISIIYGMTPSERGSSDSGSGLGNESMDLTIGTQETMADQDVTNDGFFRFYTEIVWGIKGWKLRHVVPEMQDKKQEANRIGVVLANVTAALSVGFEVRQMEAIDYFDVEIIGEPFSPEEFQSNKNLFNDFGGGMGGGQEEEGDAIEQNTGGPAAEGAPEVPE